MSRPFTLENRQKLQEVYNKSYSRSEILSNLGYSPSSGGPYRTLKQREKDWFIDTVQFERNCGRWKTIEKIANLKGSGKTLADLYNGSNIQNREIKKLLLENNLKDYICSRCGIPAEYNNKPLTLQLDHIDGNNSNNEISNLRFLCPNCHSQTPTYGRKNRG